MNQDPLEQYKHKYERVELGKNQPENNAKEIHCPSCGSGVPVANLNINDKIGKCSNCNQVFSFHEDIMDLMQIRTLKQEIIRPEGVDIFNFKEDLEITVKQALHPLELIPAIIFPTFSVLMTILFFAEGIPFLVPTIFILLSTIALGNLIRRKKHKILIDIVDDQLFISWKPKKLRRNKSFDTMDIDQVYAKKIAHTNSASLHLILNGQDGQKHVTIVDHLESHSQARFIEQEIERHLGIKDRQVPEES